MIELNEFLKRTPMLDFQHPCIQKVVKQQGWRNLSEKEKIAQIYDFVRNDIKFGYNSGDDITASQVLQDGYGQCNTKSTLLMALLRAVDIPCRIQGFYIDKKMQKGALTGLVYFFAPEKVVHAWTEVYVEEQWLALEGVIIDDRYLQQVKDRLSCVNNGYIGYGIAVEQKENINLCFNGQSTYIQSFSITDKLGIFTSPDEFFQRYNNTKIFVKRVLFNFLRKRINRRLERIRNTSSINDGNKGI
ncbi:transglutaminase-like domain-containing protein [Lysinibacillus sp. LZ02]|uniref:transglutaminase-like domain-containing protein n=1 Tax=Lysinibacillus sp. LZ02 TaxID=3420668 RepID=UPI003D35D9F4